MYRKTRFECHSSFFVLTCYHSCVTSNKYSLPVIWCGIIYSLEGLDYVGVNSAHSAACVHKDVSAHEYKASSNRDSSAASTDQNISCFRHVTFNFH
jgi:hypothetical protein